MGFVSIRKMWVDEVGWRTGGWRGLRFPLSADVVKSLSNLSVESSLLSFPSRSLSLWVPYILPLSGLVDSLPSQRDG